MNSVRRLAGVAGSMLGALAVACGAFGAHGLRDTLGADALALWRTAVDYQFWHALALLGLALLPAHSGCARTFACAGFLLGSLLFSGSLYALSLGAPHWIGLLTPLGGVALLTGWLALIWVFWREIGP